MSAPYPSAPQQQPYCAPPPQQQYEQAQPQPNAVPTAYASTQMAAPPPYTQSQPQATAAPYPQAPQGAPLPVYGAQPTIVHVHGVPQPLPVCFGSMPQRAYCPRCKTEVMTRVSQESNSMAWMWCMVLFIVGFFVVGLLWLFCWVPFCMDGCQDHVHLCPQCHTQLGRKSL